MSVWVLISLSAIPTSLGLTGRSPCQGGPHGTKASTYQAAGRTRLLAALAEPGWGIQWWWPFVVCTTFQSGHFGVPVGPRHLLRLELSHWREEELWGDTEMKGARSRMCKR